MGKAVIPEHTCWSPSRDAAPNGGLSFPHNVVFSPVPIFPPSIYCSWLWGCWCHWVRGRKTPWSDHQSTHDTASTSNFLINYIGLISYAVYRAMRCQTKSVFVTLIRSSSVCQALFSPWFCAAIRLLFLSIESISHFWVLLFSTLWLKLILLTPPLCLLLCEIFCVFPHECVATTQYLWQQGQFVFLSFCSQKLRIKWKKCSLSKVNI